MTGSLSVSRFDGPEWPACPRPFNAAEHVLGPDECRPDAGLALVVADGEDRQQLTYGALRAGVQSMAAALLQAGCRPGDRVLLRVAQGIAFPFAYFGALWAGLVPVPTSASLTPREVEAMVSRIAPRVIVAQDGLPVPPGTATPVLPVETLMLRQTSAAKLPAPHRGDPDRPAYVVFTSGSTAAPLAVVHAHRAVWARGMMRKGWHDIGPRDRVLHLGMLNWTYTLGVGLVDPWTVGATAMIAGAATTPQDWTALADDLRPTVLAGVPGHFRHLLQQDLSRLTDLRHGLSAGERLLPSLRRDWQGATGTDLHEALGMSEVSTFLSGAPLRPAPPGTSGYPQPCRRVAVLEEDGQPVPPGQSGVLAVHRSDPGLMLGYLDDPERTAAAYAGDWFVTGDRMQVDAGGAYLYLGRRDDLMTVGGFRIAPQEIEVAMTDCPGLADCAVTEAVNPAGARRVVGLYVAISPLGPEALRTYAGARLAVWKCPHHWQAVASLPRNANGKLLRRALPALVQWDPK